MCTETFEEIGTGVSTVRIPLGAILLADELIQAQDLDFALDHQKYAHQPLGEILIRIGALMRDDLDKALKLQDSSRL